jgi:hypothetical protein
MSMKAGALVHTGDTVLIQRLQTGGPNNVNVPSTRVNELGNYQAVAVSHDIPDLTFTMESFDATCAMEALLTKLSGSPGPYNIGNPQAIDVASEWLAGDDQGASEFNVVEGVGLPYLMPDSISYRFGLTDMASQSVSMRGDSIYYCPGPVLVDAFIGSGASAQTCLLTQMAGLYNGDTIGGSRRTLNVTANGIRLIFGVDYTETITLTAAAFNTTTVHLIKAVPTGAPITIMYFTNEVVAFDAGVHTAPSVKPAAIRGKDITVMINGTDVTDRWTGVQSVSIDERFNITKDEELGNAFAVAIEFLQAPDVTGSLTVRSKSPQDLHSRLMEIFDISTATEAIGAQTFFDNRIDVVLHHPDTGAVLKILEVPDAVFTLPGYSGRVNTIADLEFKFESDSGTLIAYDDVDELP